MSCGEGLGPSLVRDEGREGGGGLGGLGAALDNSFCLHTLRDGRHRHLP